MHAVSGLPVPGDIRIRIDLEARTVSAYCFHSMEAGWVEVRPMQMEIKPEHHLLELNIRPAR